MEADTNSLIKKAKRLTGRTLVFRNVTSSDDLFILTLRTDGSKSRYLNPTTGNIQAQNSWLKRYSEVNDQAYFIIEFKGQPIGTVRLYDAQGSSFCWGSWILANDAPSTAAIESALIVYSYAIDYLGFKSAHFDVRKENKNVCKFHEKFGAVCISETDLDCFYEISLDSIRLSMNKYKKYLPNKINVN